MRSASTGADAEREALADNGETRSLAPDAADAGIDVRGIG